MRTCVLAIALFVAAGPVAAAPPSTGAAGAPPRAACPTTAPTPAAGGPGLLKRLAELPPGRHELTVLRSVDGCPVATIKVGSQTYTVPVTRAPGLELTPSGAPARRR